MSGFSSRLCRLLQFLTYFGCFEFLKFSSLRVFAAGWDLVIGSDLVYDEAAELVPTCSCWSDSGALKQNSARRDDGLFEASDRLYK